MPVFNLDYRLADKPHQQRLELDQASLTQADAALHLLMLHFGDSENSLLMPQADASAAEVLAQAELLGLSHITVTPER
ncbi:hypothetical protein [Pseudomonas cremoricolorata]|uniref:Uncharacterized protein n=1 Tax=Pseudomonas cremoricolorata TaxID=157783 RepID=A0A089WWU1_9PSED|nr:hypothetical protein [Pseudomonas cremoricolorata]AIR91082.1 hypothetical protein LK03_18215 [Pseudomonas cremoricolorata]